MEKIELTRDQKVAAAVFSDFLVDNDKEYMALAGAAGTGKTTLVRELLRTIKDRMKMYSILIGKDADTDLRIELCASTHKAAAVLSKVLGRRVSTIHSRLGLKPFRDYQTGEESYRPGPDGVTLVENSLLVIDETSMLGPAELVHIKDAVRGSKVLMIGDQYQLAPVNQDHSMLDVVEATRANLEEIVRHGGVIAQAGAQYRDAVKTGVFTQLVPNGKEIIHATPNQFQKMVEDEFLSPNYTSGKARILAWTNHKVQAYNTYLRRKAGMPEHLTEDDILITNKPIIGSDRSIVKNTDQEVSITEVLEERITPEGIRGRRVKVDHEHKGFLPDDHFAVDQLKKKLAKEKDWSKYFEVKDRWLDLRPVYASTVHKSQGSTFDTVYINLADIGKNSSPSDVARMMYVAITRASKRVVLYGQLPPQYQGLRN